MFKTYSHAELLPASIFGEAGTHHWQFVELEMQHPWFYIEVVRDYGSDVVGSMLMIPSVPTFQQMLSELDEYSWLNVAHLISPGHLRGGRGWVMEPLIGLSVAEDSATKMEGYIYKVAGGVCYSLHHMAGLDNLNVTELIFSADRDLGPRR
jgi:hypothetical protein